MKHLKGLDTLRAIAALIVVWSHIELIKEWNGISRINFFLFPNAHYSVILSVVSNPFFNIDNVVTKFLGKISYGIYMYHWLIILLVIRLTSSLINHSMYNIYVYILSFGLTILISWFSYVTYERFFLNLKKKFEI